MASVPFNNLITFSRGSNATVTGSNGLIQWAPSNLLTNSEQFDNAAWTKSNVTIYPNQDILGGALGPELLTNGTFSGGTTGWVRGFGSVDGTFTASAGVATYTVGAGDGPSPRMVATVTGLVVGNYYKISFDEVSATGTGDRYVVWTSSSAGTGGATLDQAGTGGWLNENKTYYYPATATTMYIAVGFNSTTAGDTLSIDNISIKEVTPAAATAPDGTQTADTMLTNGTVAAQRLGQNTAPATATTGISTFSIYVKAGTAQFVQLLQASDGNAYANFDVASGSLGTRGTGSSSTITDVGNGWYRCTLTFNVASGSLWYFYIAPSASATYGQAFTSATAGVLIWGAQLELGSAATTYNSTTVKNLLGFSEAFDNAAWAKSGSSIVTGAQANPVNGAFNAQKLMENTATSTQHYIRLNSVAVPIAPLVFSVYVKASGRTNVRLVNASYGNAAYFTLTGAGSVGTTDGATGSITAIGDGWYRCAVSFTQTVATTVGFDIRLANASTGGSDIYTGDGNSGVYIYGAQLSDSASLDPYVPTPAAAPSSTAYYGPRFDYDPVTLAPKGLLVEEARTNLVLTSAFQTLAGSAGSQYPSGTGWSNFFNTGGTRTYVASSVFTGAQAMDIVGVSAARSLIGFSFAAASSTTYTVSFYIESVSGVTGIVAYASGTLGTGGTSNSITAPTSTGRVSYTFTTGTGAGTIDLRFGIGAAANENGSIRISNVQCEAGAFATSYIPTVASTVTRSADVATINGSLFSQWYGQTQGTIVSTFSSFATITASRIVAELSDGTTNNRYTQVHTPTGSDRFLTFSGGSAVVTTLDYAAVGVNVIGKWAGAYAAGNYGASLNGAAALSATYGSVLAGINSLTIGISVGGGALNGHIQSINFIPARAADFQLQALTL